MPIQTDLSISPHFDDFKPEKDFYRVLFRPGTSVQVRELNQLQSILQNQISSFGDNIYRQGTIIEGCDLTFHDDLKYIKLRDSSSTSELLDVSEFKGFRIKNQNDLQPLEATIIETERGFEATDPNLNTLYLRYLNSGFKTNGPADGITKFEAQEQLTVYDPKNVVERITFSEKSQGFSPNDKVVFLSAIAIQNTSGGTDFGTTYIPGMEISDGTARATVVGVFDNLIENTKVLSIKPVAEDLQAGDASKWTFAVDTNIEADEDSLTTAQVTRIIGTGATGVLTTSTLGRIESIQVTNKGSGYLIAPTVTISSKSNLLNNIEIFDANVETFKAKVIVAPSITLPVGNSYGVTVGEGIIYQKGFFVRVSEQLLIVDKYDNQPDDVTVGFDSDEEIVTANQDTSLLDNATGAPNETAPGANRLKLTPKLVSLPTEEANARDDFLFIAKFSDGRPFQQNRQTVYNIIGNEISRRLSEESGDYVLDKFRCQTKSAETLEAEEEFFSVVIDPGTAYINGVRVETNSNFVQNVQKGSDLVTISNANISMNFGNFIRVNQLAGVLDFKAGAVIELYKTATQYFDTYGVGSPINRASLSLSATDLAGYARVRSIVQDSGIPGTKEAIYRVYLYDIKLNSGVRLEDCSSIFYDGTIKAIADISDTRLQDPNTSSLLFYAGAEAVNNVSSVSYIYRTNSQGTFSTGGTLTIALSGGGTEEFPYTGELSSIQERDLIVVPTTDLEASTNLSGTIAVTNGSNTATISGSTSFAAELRSGDYIKVAANDQPLQITAVRNNGTVSFAQNADFTASGATFKYVFPANIAIAFEYRQNRFATVDSTRKNLTLNLGTNLSSSQTATIFYNVKESDVTPVPKTVNRNTYVRIVPGTNGGINIGPWCLGVPDAFRLNKVYLGPNSNFEPDDLDVVDVTSSFYIDNNQTENYVDQSFLYMKANAPVNLPNNSEVSLLVCFDYFSTAGEGLKAPGSSGTYNIDDGISLASASNSIHTLEVPEMYGTKGQYYDLRDYFDLRPSVESTVTPATDPTSAPVNPAELIYSNKFSTTNKKFPSPQSELFSTISYFQGRTDLAIVDVSSNFRILKGTPGADEAPSSPENSLTIQQFKVPAYPSLPYLLSNETLQYSDTKISSGPFTGRRLNNFRVQTVLNSGDIQNFQPRGYTMKDIGQLERRIEQLEYYTSLNLVETFAQKRFIPGFDGLNRFKFGFFVDGFEDYTYSDTSDPRYSSSIVDGYLSPALSELTLSVEPVNVDESTLKFNEVSFISQLKATDGPVQQVDTVEPSTPTPTPTPEPTPEPVLVQKIVSIIQSQRSTNRSSRNTPNVFEDFFYTFSASSGPVEFYLNSRDNLIGVEVFQSTSPEGPWVSTKNSSSALPITKTDRTSKGLTSLNSGQKIEHLGKLERKSTPSGTSWGTWIEDQFKMLWTHNPDSGIYYRIRIYKGPRDGGFFGGQGRGGTFGFKLFYPTDVEVNEINSVTTTNYDFRYHGLPITVGGTGGRYSPQLTKYFEH